MKTALKLILFFGFVMFMDSCTKNKNSLTKEYVLEHLTEKSALNPIVFKTGISNIYLNSENDIRNGTSYYSKLYNEGYLTTQLRTDIPNPESSSRPYKVLLSEKAEPFILEKKGKNIEVISLEFNVIEVKEIRILSDFKAEADVIYKKMKTPFHNANEKDISGSGKEYPNDTYIKNLEFRKNSTTNEWKLPIKIMF